MDATLCIRIGQITIAAVIAASPGALAQTFAGPWHHVPNAVNKYQLDQDDARCRVVAAQTQVDSTTPSVVARVRWTTQINCMKALGYVPGPPAKAMARRTKGGLEELSAAGSGVGITLCSEFNKSREKTEIEALFFTWAEGYLTGWNMGLPAESLIHAELSSIPRSEQMEFLRNWCESNPTKRYMEGATKLFVRLRQHAE